MQKLTLSGQRFGRLKVYQEAPGKAGYWVCVCDCDPKKIITVRGASLTSGNTKSCGCLRKEGRSIVRGQNKRKPPLLVDIGMLRASGADEHLMKIVSKLRKLGVEFNATRLTYVVTYNGMIFEYGPFPNPYAVLGHVLLHGVGDMTEAQLKRLERERAKKQLISK